ncbi:PDGF_2 domain-containing protein [Caerostris extrusa]|uniref:PDGF_2 domain-containing protein n=1 Tax=Caerostris extrusa TaxID=172846 RepID=A0AAV4SE42_CAEEX|nr:PDGF_2 domain-containing protein [Caerostris extrusa]
MLFRVHSTSYPSVGGYEGRPSFYGPPTSPRSSESSRAASKDYYKMNGYSVKSTSATKSALVDPSSIPQELLEVREANEHFVRMRSGARCSAPRSEVVCVRDLYPEKEFLPRCTLLHRCTETSGCCEDDALQCAPKAMQEVVLHFYVLGGDHRSSDVEKLWFVNHTECECQPKPSLETSTDSIGSTPTDTEVTKTVVDQYPQGDQKYRKCRSCPSPFCVRELEDGRCSCDCFDRHKPCIRIKRGRDALSEMERRCVLGGHCNIPDCDYGPYDPERGRCPKRPDHENFKGMEQGKRPLPNSRNPNHRWLYFERD